VASQADASRIARVIRASPATIYAALMDPAALVSWLPPGGMRGVIRGFDGRVGGGYEMSLIHTGDGGARAVGKTSPEEDRVRVRFLELVPRSRILEEAAFASADPALRAPMRIAIDLTEVAGGTEVAFTFSGLPAGVDPTDNAAGTRQSLAQLAAWCEHDPGR
jgi:uncharacterized protein YndB with AHSA1/START domain